MQLSKEKEAEMTDLVQKDSRVSIPVTSGVGSIDLVTRSRKPPE